MKSALIALMVEEGWRLGIPLAVIIERIENNKRFISNAFVYYITSAEHDHVVFGSKDGKKGYMIDILPKKKLYLGDDGRRQMRINMSDGEQTFNLHIGQNVSFAKKALALKERLTCEHSIH